MVAHTRLFSELSSDSDAIQVPEGEISSSHSKFPTIAHGNQSSKRRKISPLNSRFDRMVDIMNATSRHHSTSHRANLNVSGSSNVGDDMPRTPLHAFENLQESRLGKYFSLIKLPRTPNTRKPGKQDINDASSSSCDSYKTSPSDNRNCKPLPTWLVNTFSTLSYKHPLRLLLPSSSSSQRPASANAVPNSLTDAIYAPNDEESLPENEIFAFTLPEKPQLDYVDNSGATLKPSAGIQLSTPFSYRPEQPPPMQDNVDSLFYTRDTGKLNIGVPFSTPGPALSSIIAPPIGRPLPLPVFSPHEEDSPFNSHSPPFLAQTFWRGDTSCDTSLENLADEFLNDDLLDDDAPSNQLLPDSPYTHSFIDHFATPGTTHVVPYFDSPIEDPLVSVLPAFDQDALDFRWTKFDIEASVNAEKIFLEHQPKPLLTSRLTSTETIGFDATSGLQLHPVLPSIITANESAIPARSKSPPGPCGGVTFAPAPGIFVSPLSDSSQKSDRLAPIAPRQAFTPDVTDTSWQCDKLTDNRANSQDSDDSIKSWNEG